MLLVVVADVHICAEADCSGIGRDKAVDDPENCGFAGSVAADQGGVVASSDFKPDIVKELLPVKGLGEMPDLHDIPSAFDAGLQYKVHVIAQLNGAVCPLHF